MRKVTQQEIDARIAEAAEYNVTIDAATVIAGVRGWQFRTRTDMDSYQFESISVAQGSRCVRQVFADSRLEAAQKLTPPVW